MYVILTYDIKLDETGPRVLRRVFKLCKKYLTHIQNSVFEGELSESQIMQLNSELKKYIRDDKDSVIIFKSRHERWLEKDFWGKCDNKLSNIF
ncbi:Hypothetical protein LUCI_1338 [Lucifera butyrica]|uniref:CRISPR-associated endoribonuclease Cas2 n=1 Tax=Lucifera butyrica TaxID=1351585 RepID=A0A498R7I3_9FIRM|nr:CRISPR-associated endonuclease Cas2 [Lucifera butyrica]VBB06123.1 Hypothetical protein LUCI_1338 [Lucifera butyrica]